MHSTTVQGCMNEVRQTMREKGGSERDEGIVQFDNAYCGFNKFYVEAALKLRCKKGKTLCAATEK